jgi:hypothetical protein
MAARRADVKEAYRDLAPAGFRFWLRLRKVCARLFRPNAQREFSCQRQNLVLGRLLFV